MAGPNCMTSWNIPIEPITHDFAENVKWRLFIKMIITVKYLEILQYSETFYVSDLVIQIVLKKSMMPLIFAAFCQHFSGSFSSTQHCQYSHDHLKTSTLYNDVSQPTSILLLLNPAGYKTCISRMGIKATKSGKIFWMVGTRTLAYIGEKQ